MSGFGDTVDLERSLLNIVTSSGMMCRMHIHRLNDEWLSSKERKFISALAQETFRSSKSILTDTILEYDVGSKIEDKEQWQRHPRLHGMRFLFQMNGLPPDNHEFQTSSDMCNLHGRA